MDEGVVGASCRAGCGPWMTGSSTMMMATTSRMWTRPPFKTPPDSATSWRRARKLSVLL